MRDLDVEVIESLSGCSDWAKGKEEWSEDREVGLHDLKMGEP